MQKWPTPHSQAMRKDCRADDIFTNKAIKMPKDARLIGQILYGAKPNAENPPATSAIVPLNLVINATIFFIFMSCYARPKNAMTRFINSSSMLHDIVIFTYENIITFNFTSRR